MNSIEYFAGIFDGEGCFAISLSLRYHKGRPWLNITPIARVGMKKANDLLAQMQQILGTGKIYISNDGKINEVISWQTTQWAEVKKVAEIFLPYLIEKKEQAKKMIEIVQLYDICHGDEKRMNGCPTRPKEAILKIIEISLTLNPKSSQADKRRIAKPMEYWTKIVDEIYNYRDLNPMNKGGMPSKFTDEQLLTEVKRIHGGDYSWKKDRKWKELAKYRFGSWSEAVKKVNDNDNGKDFNTCITSN